MSIDVSVIIPCFNEIQTISECITKLAYELTSNNLIYEIIVVDNGSSDGSDIIAKKNHAKVFYSKSSTVAGVRNDGFCEAQGMFIIFMDADIIVMDSWGSRVCRAIENMKNNDNFITGSRPIVPNNMNSILTAWYTSISQDTRDTYLGTGHMILSKNNFIRIGQFNKNLPSGEDFDFCRRAKKMGVNIISDPFMKVYHFGYPNNLINFAKREIWHGEGDCVNLANVINSPVALVSILFLLVHILLTLFLFINTYLSIILMFVIIFIVFSVNYYKFSFGDITSFIKRCLITYLYLFSRGLSLPLSILKRIFFKFCT